MTLIPIVIVRDAECLLQLIHREKHKWRILLSDLFANSNETKDIIRLHGFLHI